MAAASAGSVVRGVSGERMGPAAARRQVLDALPLLVSDAEPLRREYVRIIERDGVPFAENITDPHAWAVYVFHVAWLERLVPDREAQVLDWGGGNGHVTALLRKSGFRNAANYLLHVPSHYTLFRDALGIPTRLGGEPNVLALPDESIDVFVSSGVLEHVREDGLGDEESVLREARRVLRRGGLLFVWNLPTWLAPSDLVGKATGGRWHPFRYRERDVRGLLERAEFALLDVWRYGGTPLAFALKRLLGRGRPGDVFRWDAALARVPPFSTFANNFSLVARRR